MICTGKGHQLFEVHNYVALCWSPPAITGSSGAVCALDSNANSTIYSSLQNSYHA